MAEKTINAKMFGTVFMGLWLLDPDFPLGKVIVLMKFCVDHPEKFAEFWAYMSKGDPNLLEDLTELEKVMTISEAPV